MDEGPETFTCKWVKYGRKLKCVGFVLKPRERFLKAVLLEEPDRVPMFELEFQKAEEVIGRRVIKGEDYEEYVRKGKGMEILKHNIRVIVDVCRSLGYDAIRIYAVHDVVEGVRYARKIAPEFAIVGSADGTLGIPGKIPDFVRLVKRMKRDRDNLKKELLQRIRENIESAKAQIEAGADVIVGCADYCTNSGPFIHPRDFRELVIPYLKMLVSAVHRAGALYIKHTDGNLWPIIEDLVSTGIDALHSIDPTAGMDLGRVKELYGDRICLCGNVSIDLLHRGTPKQVYESTKECIEKAAYGGGYILCTSNVVEVHHPLENVLAMFEARRRYGIYPIR